MTLDILKRQFGYCEYALDVNTRGVSHEESLQAPEPAGNCLNWIVGHILATRGGALKVLDRVPVWSEGQAEPYRRGAPPLSDPELAIPLEQILKDLKTSQERLESGLAEFDSKRLHEKAPFGPGGDSSETNGSLLAVLAFHEAYHVGQTGLLRRILAREGHLT